MKKLLLLSFLFVVDGVYCQANLDYVTLYGSSVIKPTWKSVTTILFMSRGELPTTMKKYNYSLSTDKTEYIANTSVGTPYFIVNKGEGEARIYSEVDNGFAKAFRLELKAIMGGVLSPSFSNGFETYLIKYIHEDIVYKMEVLIKENKSGGSTVGIILR